MNLPRTIVCPVDAGRSLGERDHLSDLVGLDVNTGIEICDRRVVCFESQDHRRVGAWEALYRDGPRCTSRDLKGFALKGRFGIRIRKGDQDRPFFLFGQDQFFGGGKACLWYDNGSAFGLRRRV